MTDATKQSTLLSQLPRPEKVREQLGRAKRKVSLLKQLLKLSEKAAQDGDGDGGRTVADAR